MGLLSSLLIWIVAGGWIGARAGRHEGATGRWLILGIVGGVAGGFLWLPAFFAGPPETPALIARFDFLTFHLFAALCGADALFLAVLGARAYRNRLR